MFKRNKYYIIGGRGGVEEIGSAWIQVGVSLGFRVNRKNKNKLQNGLSTQGTD